MIELKHWKRKRKDTCKIKKISFSVQCRRKHFGLDYLLSFRFDLSLQDKQIKKTISQAKVMS